MIISPRRNFIFVHIPKTGGTSLALALEGRAAKDDILIGDTPKAIKRRGRLKGVTSAGRLWKHSTLADIEGLVSRDFIEQAYTVTMVRNPWDRMVSYYHWLKEQSFDHPAVARARALPFDAFLRDPQTRAAFRQNQAMSYMRGPGGQERASLYIRLEQFAEDAAPLWDHLGFELDLPHLNRSDRRPDYRVYYDEALADLVFELFEGEIMRFDYRY